MGEAYNRSPDSVKDVGGLNCFRQVKKSFIEVRHENFQKNFKSVLS